MNEVTTLFNVLGGFTKNVVPGTILLGMLLIALTRQLKDFRIFVHVLLFILIRDSMTPLRLWRITSALDIEFLLSSVALVVLGLLSLFVVFLLRLLESDLAAVFWFKDSVGRGTAAGIVAGITMAIVVSYGKKQVGEATRVAISLAPVNQSWLAVLFFSLCTNLYEEYLFRGILQSRLEEIVSPIRAAMASGLFFACAHIGLAFTVTSIGTPVLVFTCMEGLMAALLRMRFGLIPATVFHGLLIFFLASGVSDAPFY
jgi:membrane protease YdiL (CAAX protease family)